jgi:hypothetical protein
LNEGDPEPRTRDERRQRAALVRVADRGGTEILALVDALTDELAAAVDRHQTEDMLLTLA